MSNTKPVDYTFVERSDADTPIPPKVGYFDENKANTPNSASTLKALLQNNCSLNGNNTLSPDDPNKYYMETISGKINEDCGTTSVSSQSSLKADVDNACDDDRSKIVNQIKYLLCQLAYSRNRVYNSSDFDIFNSVLSVKDIFDKFANIKMVMYLVFLLSMYFLVQGFFSSFDVASNMMNLVEENSSKTLTYYLFLGLGVAIPVLILCILFVKTVCGNIESLEKYNITDDFFGKKETVSSGFKGLDYSVLMIFLFLIYGLVVSLFVVNKSGLGGTMHMVVVSSIFFIISIFLYIFYNFIPFFATANIKNYSKEDIDLKLYVDKNGTEYPGKVESNQLQVQKLQKVFLQASVVILVFFIVYIFASKKMQDSKGFMKDAVMGFFGASAILLIPIFWVANFILSTKYFYIYPLIILGARFVRYIGMALIYGQYSYAQEYGIEGFYSGDTFSEDLKEQLDDFSNYSPSYNLIGMGLIKSLMNLLGYENIFSKKYTNANKFNNLAANRYLIPGIFSYLGKDKNANEDQVSAKLYVQIFIAAVTLLVTYILLKVVYKV